jgi:hypothetical protein
MYAEFQLKNMKKRPFATRERRWRIILKGMGYDEPVTNLRVPWKAGGIPSPAEYGPLKKNSAIFTQHRSEFHGSELSFSIF